VNRSQRLLSFSSLLIVVKSLYQALTIKFVAKNRNFYEFEKDKKRVFASFYQGDFFEYYNAVIHQKRTKRIGVGIWKIARTKTEYEIKKSFLICNKRLISLPLFFPSIFGNINKQI